MFTKYIVAAVILLLVIVTSMTTLLFKRTRHLTKYFFLLSAASIFVAALYLYSSLKPLTFSRDYLSQNFDAEEYKIAQKAKAKGIYFGAATDSVEIITTNSFQATFNSLTPENALKIGSLLTNLDKQIYDFSKADALVNQALKQNLTVRGHPLVFGKLSDLFNSPDLDQWLEQYPEVKRQEKLQSLVDIHIQTLLEHFKGRISEWDVVNEPLDTFRLGKFEENIYYRYLGKSYIKNAFLLAHQTDPNVKLYLNEQLTHYSGPKAEAFYRLVADLLKDKIPLHGVGLQHHMLFEVETPENTAHYVKRLTDLGLEVKITEIDARLRLFKKFDKPYDAQGRYYRDTLAALLPIKGFKGMTFWGVNDSRVWHDSLSYLFPLPNEPYLFDAQFKAKPGLHHIHQLLSNGNLVRSEAAYKYPTFNPPN